MTKGGGNKGGNTGPGPPPNRIPGGGGGGGRKMPDGLGLFLIELRKKGAMKAAVNRG